MSISKAGMVDICQEYAIVDGTRLKVRVFLMKKKTVRVQSPTRITLHDSLIDRIVCTDDFVEFHFSSHFYHFDKDNASLDIKQGSITFYGCNSEDFSCYYFRRKATKNGAKLYGTPMTLEAVEDLLVRKSIKIEVYLSLADTNSIHWRGEIWPYKKRGLSDCLIIEASGFSSIVCSWDD